MRNRSSPATAPCSRTLARSFRAAIRSWGRSFSGAGSEGAGSCRARRRGLGGAAAGGELLAHALTQTRVTTRAGSVLMGVLAPDERGDAPRPGRCHILGQRSTIAIVDFDTEPRGRRATPVGCRAGSPMGHIRPPGLRRGIAGGTLGWCRRGTRLEAPAARSEAEPGRRTPAVRWPGSIPARSESWARRSKPSAVPSSPHAAAFSIWVAGLSSRAFLDRRQSR